MQTADLIRKRGFKKWYERQLIESHLYLVSCFLCMILVAAGIEEMSFRAPGLKPVMMLVMILAGGAVGLVSWQRYRTIMVAAERLGDRSTCEQCHAYAKFDIVDSGGNAADDADGAGTWLRVRCRKCGHGWKMP